MGPLVGPQGGCHPVIRADSIRIARAVLRPEGSGVPFHMERP